MKGKILTLITAAALFTACGKDGVVSDSSASANNKDVELTICIPAGSTKVTYVQESDETFIADIQLFIFDEYGSLEYYERGSRDTYKVRTSTGYKNIVAVANADDFSKVRTQDELESIIIPFVNARKGFIMFGKLDHEYVSAEDNRKSIGLDRRVAKIVLEKIWREFDDEYNAKKMMIIKSIYISEVSGNTLLGGGMPAKADRVWFNRLGYQASDPNLLLHNDVKIMLPNNSGYGMTHSFYAYPNNIDNKPAGSESAKWSERRTMLVLETELNGELNYYAVYLPALESNKTYTVTNFRLTKPGSKHAWEPVTLDEIGVVITPAQWSAGAEGEVNA